MSQIDRANVCSDPYRAALEDPGAVVADLIRDVITAYWGQFRQKPAKIHLPDGLVALLEAHFRRVGPLLPAGKLVNKDQLFGLQPVYGADKFRLELASASNAPQMVSLDGGTTFMPAMDEVRVVYRVESEEADDADDLCLLINCTAEGVIKDLYRGTFSLGTSSITVQEQADALWHPNQDDPALGVQPTDGDEPITEEDERQHPYQDWQAIVRDGDTRLGYEDWVRHRKDEARHDAQMEVVAMAARRDAAAEPRPETYRQIIVDVPKIDCDVMIKLPGGVDWIQVQLRPSNADTNYNGSLDVILPRNQAVTLWSGDDMQPSTAVEADPNTRIGKQIVTELPGDYS